MRPNLLPTALLAATFCLLPAAGSAQRPDLYDESVLRTFTLAFKQPDWWKQLEKNYAIRLHIKADLTVDGVTYPDVGVRFRGHSSYNSIPVTSRKKPFGIALDEFNPAQRLYGYKTLNLNNEYNDPTLVREVVASRLMRRFVPAPRANYVKLVINGENFGVYTSVEQINKDFLRQWLRDEDGNRYKADRTGSNNPADSALTWLGTRDPAPYQKAYLLKSSPSLSAWTDLIDLIFVLNKSKSLRTDLPKVLDVDNVIWFLALLHALPSLDSYIGFGTGNYYLYHDPWHDRFSLFPWDMDSSFGTHSDNLTVSQLKTLSPFYQQWNTTKPLINKVLLTHPDWIERYVAHLRSILAVYDWRIIGPWVAAYQALIEPELRLDSKRLYPMALFKKSLTEDVELIDRFFRKTTVPGLRPFIEARRSYLLNHRRIKEPVPVISGVRQNPGRPIARDTVWVTGKVTGAARVGSVTLFHRVRGPWNEAPMFDDGKHQDGKALDGIHGASIAPLPASTRVEYYLRAQTVTQLGAGATFHPEQAASAPLSYRVGYPTRTSPVTINEFVARNDSGVQDEKGEFEDWIELFNASEKWFLPGGLFLTDDLGFPTKWKIPSSAAIAPRGTLLVWADNDPLDGPLHASFKLASRGEEIALFDIDGQTLLDTIEFGPQEADVSTGRLVDGASPWVTFAAPTPRSRNMIRDCGFRSFSALDPLEHVLRFSPGGAPFIGTKFSMSVAGGLPNGIYAIALAGSAQNLWLPGFGFSVMIGFPILTVDPLPSDPRGRASFLHPVPNMAALVGLSIFEQPFGFAPSLRFVAGNAVEIRFCGYKSVPVSKD
ncbi:MAG: CotH kinase family protein [Planctomycetota bacterium]